jgi:hypothetical protein
MTTYRVATVTLETGEKHTREITTDDRRSALISPDIPAGERAIYVMEKVEPC